MKNSKREMKKNIYKYGKNDAICAGLVALISAIVDWGYIFVLNRMYGVIDSKSFGKSLLMCFVAIGIIIIVTDILNGIINVVITKELSLIEKGYMEYVFSLIKEITPYQFEEQRTLRIIQNVNVNKYGIIMYYHEFMMLWLRHIPYFLGLLIFLGYIYPPLVIVMLITFLPSVCAWKVRKDNSSKMAGKLGNQKRRMEAYKDYLIRLPWMQETRFFGMENRIKGLFSQSIAESNKIKVRFARCKMGIDLIVSLFYIAGMVAVFCSLLVFSRKGLVNGAEIATVLTILISIYDNMNSVMNGNVATIVENYGKMEVLEELKTLTEASSEKKCWKDRIESILLEDVSFRYPDSEKAAISSVTTKLQRGDIIAIVGENGSGKTTLAKIIAGAFYPQEGNIYINNCQIDRNEKYSERVSVVWQDYKRYPLSLAENLLMEEYDERKRDHIEDLIEQIGLKESLKKKEIQPGTMLSKEFGGTDLSGGEWQRVAIGRAIARDADVVVFDEPTAAIDPMEELNIMKLLLSLCKNKVALLITHRIGAAKLADYVLVMKEGKIIEQGNHEELMKLGGEYYNMYNAQSKWYKPM